MSDVMTEIRATLHDLQAEVEIVNLRLDRIVKAVNAMALWLSEGDEFRPKDAVAIEKIMKGVG